MKKIILITMFSLIGMVVFSQNQTTVSGKVTNDKNEPLPGVSVKVKNGTEGTTTNVDGKFSIKAASLPVVLVITSTEYFAREIDVTSTDDVNIIMSENEKTLLEVVVGETGDARLKGHLVKQPISIEMSNRRDFNNAASGPLGTMFFKKGVDVTLSSITFPTISTRGFNGSGSSRVNQLMDGMDNQAPGLNFPVGNFVGLSDLDLESITLLPGASSALYGPGGMNGTLIFSSRNPFKSQGFSFLIKNGITDIGKEQRNKAGGYYDYSLRWAKSFNDKFAFKIGAQYLQANDWLANDTTNYFRTGGTGRVVSGTRQTDANYDGVNVYGDETTFNVHVFPNGQGGTLDLWNLVGQGIKAAYPQLGPGIDAALRLTAAPLHVSRTGYNETDVIDPKTKNIKLNGALHYRFNKDIEAILAGHWATGNTVYTGNNRYALKDIKIGQYKLELRSQNWFIRGYTTQEDAGEAYSATVTSQLFNEGWKGSGTWYQQYAQNYLVPAATVWLQTYAQYGSAATADAALLGANMNFHNMGRFAADQGRPVAGSDQFKRIFDSVRMLPIPSGGLFVEQSQMWMGEAQYNLKDKIKFAEVIIGGNVKKYILDSENTLFFEPNGPIKINEWGAYAQATKPVFEDKLTLGLSARYDKNENFKGKFTPRVTALLSVAEDHNFRFSYQTAYKFPTTQQQWIRLDIGNAILLGGLPWINEYMNVKTRPTFVYDPANPPGAPFTYQELKPESMRSFEVGYKAYVDKKLLIDMYAYFGKYTNFLGRIILIQPTVPGSKPYSIVTNSSNEVKTWGAGIGFDYKMTNNFFSFLNAYTDNLTDVPSGFQAGFSTPKYRLNAGFGNSGLGKEKRIGFNVNVRWQDDFYWESGGLADGTVPSYTSLDAQVNYKLLKIKSMIKIGGTNITNNYYRTGFGNPYIGGMYYISFGYNIL